MTYCTPLMIIQYATDQGHSVYYLTSNTLVYKNVIDGHKQALAFQSFDGHAYFYRSAIPFAGMPAQCVKITDTACLPFRGSPQNTPIEHTHRYIADIATVLSYATAFWLSSIVQSKK